MTEVIMRLEAKAEAEVVRGCCGKSHEFGPCPFQTLSEEDS